MSWSWKIPPWSKISGFSNILPVKLETCGCSAWLAVRFRLVDTSFALLISGTAISESIYTPRTLCNSKRRSGITYQMNSIEYFIRPECRNRIGCIFRKRFSVSSCSTTALLDHRLFRIRLTVADPSVPLNETQPFLSWRHSALYMYFFGLLASDIFKWIGHFMFDAIGSFSSGLKMTCGIVLAL